MKNRIYAISLLLSLMVVLCHDMIPHHHHDDLAFNFSISYEKDDHGHKHQQNKDNQDNHDSQQNGESSSEYNHPFPIHNHISQANVFNIERTRVLESNSQIRDTILLIYNKLFIVDCIKPPELNSNPYEEPPFLISSLCSLKAIALRGPPSIA